MNAFHGRSIWVRAGAAMAAQFGAVAIVCSAVAAPAAHESPRAYCARAGTDDALRSPLASLGPAIHRLFNISGRYALTTTYYRCAKGDVLVCWVGANLPCGKANISKHLPAASQWCESHANSDFIPMYVTGHDTLYSWRCASRNAQAGAPVGKIGARGFFERYWKKVK
ncbi:MAG: hypothetical protein ACRECV_07630 [Xanthobacteraceae bacterium]